MFITNHLLQVSDFLKPSSGRHLHYSLKSYMLLAVYIVHCIETLQKAYRFIASHACRIACKLLFNKQFSVKAQNRHVGELNPICDKYLILWALLIAMRWNPEQITLLKKWQHFPKAISSPIWIVLFFNVTAHQKAL